MPDSGEGIIVKLEPSETFRGCRPNRIQHSRRAGLLHAPQAEGRSENRLGETNRAPHDSRAQPSGEQYVEFPTSAGTLAIFDADAQEKYIPGAAQPGQNRSAILEFNVASVDQEYARLQGMVKTWVKPPTTQPWGSRSIYFRDPDGNLVDFFTRVKRQ